MQVQAGSMRRSGVRSKTGLFRMLAFVLSVAASGIVYGAMVPGARSAEPAVEPAVLWDLLRSGGHFVLIRHAIAPGVGDPEGFRLNDCATQRTLSQQGREQARMIGDLFRENGFDRMTVLSSQWCRCLETAREMSVGPVTEAPFLNSFFARRDQRRNRTDTLRDYLRNADPDHPAVLVTHQVNITAITGTGVASGEMVFVRVAQDGGIVVVGSIRPSG